MRPRRRSVLVLSLALLGACHDERPTAPPRVAPSATPSRAIVSSVPGFHFLPPMVADPGPFAGQFDATRRPTVRVVCTGATGAGCPVLATFTGAAIKLDREGQSYSALWSVPANLGTGPGQYRVEVRDGATALGAADLWVVARTAELKGVTGQYVGVVRGSPLVVKFRVETVQLAGAPDAPASTAIVTQAVEPRAQDYRTDHPALPGLLLSYNTLVVGLRASATVGDVNALLSAVGGSIAGGIRGTSSVGGILVLRVPSTSHAELAAILATLRASAQVTTIVPDVALGPTVITRDGATVPEAWLWEGQPGDGNWGLETSRVPQLWNLDGAVRRLNRRVLTGVYDAGFLPQHPDLPAPIRRINAGIVSDHGTEVAGVIGALSDNGVGIDGVTPFADFVFVAKDSPWHDLALFTAALSELDAMVRARPQVVNVSLGFKWFNNSPQIFPSVDAAARDLATGTGALVHQHLSLLAQELPLPVIVAAAGNDSETMPQDARYGSPYTNAALQHGAAPIIVVESVGLTGSGGTTRAAGSNHGGHLSAPGVNVMTTTDVAVDGRAYDYRSGTSYSAPLVTGLVSYLYALDPALPQPTMTTNPVLDLLVATAVPAGGGASPRVDAFAAALELDRARGTDDVLRKLLDIDDGTLHGDQRVAGPNGADYTPDLETSTQPRDGFVSMRDFRRFRNWLLQIENPPGLAIAGSEGHRKRDLNRDDFVGSSAGENVFPRGDFNGDGIISGTATADVPGPYGGPAMTDLAVMQRLFFDRNYGRDDLPGLVYSADLEIDPSSCLGIAGAVSVGSGLATGAGADALQTRLHLPGDARRIYTAEVREGGYAARVLVRNEAGVVIASNARQFPFPLGSYALWLPVCWVLEVEVELPGSIVGGEEGRFHVTATLRDPVGGNTIPAGGVPIFIGWTAGDVLHPEGFTNEEGTFTTFAMAPSSGSGTMTVTANVHFVGQKVTKAATASYTQPPPPPEE